MRIPIVQADVGVSGSLPAPRLPANAYGTGAALASGIAEAGDAIAKAIHRRQILNSEAEAADIGTQIELAARQQDIELRRSTTDPDDYLRATTQGYETARDRLLKNAKHPYTEQILAQKLPGVQRGLLDRAATHADAMRVDATGARLDRTTSNVFTLQALTPYDDAVEQGRLWGIVESAAHDAAPVIGQKKAQDFIDEHRKKFVNGVAEQHKDADPAGFLKNADSYAVLGSEKLALLRREADAKVKADDKTHDEKMEKFYKEVEALAEEERQGRLVGLDAKARAGALTSDDLRLASAMRTVKTPAEYDHLATLINAPPDRASDPEILRIVGADIRAADGVQVTSRYSDADVRRLMAEHATGGRGLSQKDGFALIDRQRETGQRVQDQDHTLRGEQYRAALEEGRKRLGISSPFETLDPVRQKLDADFTADLNARSDWLNKNGRPSREVLNEILPRYVSAQRQEAHLGYQAQVKTLDPSVLAGPAPMDPLDPKFLQWYSATAKRVEGMATSNPNLYAIQRAQLQNLLDARKRVVDQALRTTGMDLGRGGASSRSTTPAPADRTPVDVTP